MALGVTWPQNCQAALQVLHQLVVRLADNGAVRNSEAWAYWNHVLLNAEFEVAASCNSSEIDMEALGAMTPTSRVFVVFQPHPTDADGGLGALPGADSRSIRVGAECASWFPFDEARLIAGAFLLSWFPLT